MTDHKSLTGKRVLVTGVGMKPVKHVFYDITTSKPSHTPIVSGGLEYKANIGAATAYELARAGATVRIVARSAEKLAAVRSWIERDISGALVECSPTDLGDSAALGQLVASIPDGMPLYWVQSVGLGAGTMQLADDNPYLRIENITRELLEAELSILTSTVNTVQLLLPRFRKQDETRICIVSSMSAVRSIISGSAHNAAKGALSRFTNAAMLELQRDRIFVTDVRPGGVDTGLYDSEAVQKIVAEIARNYGTDWGLKNGGLRLMPSSAVGKAVVTVLASEAHITSINMVACGQWPHEGS